jgi:hypothetical protein
MFGVVCSIWRIYAEDRSAYSDNGEIPNGVLTSSTYALQAGSINAVLSGTGTMVKSTLRSCSSRWCDDLSGLMEINAWVAGDRGCRPALDGGER